VTFISVLFCLSREEYVWRLCRIRHSRHYAESEIMPSRDSETLWKQLESCADSVVILGSMRHSPVSFAGHGGSSALDNKSLTSSPFLWGERHPRPSQLPWQCWFPCRSKRHGDASLWRSHHVLVGISIFGWRQTMPNHSGAEKLRLLPSLSHSA
jgi:hypothetical protein